MASVSNVKHSKAIQQAIRVAEFTGFERVNMVEIDGLYYWLTSYIELANSEIGYMLDFAAPTSLIAYNDTITGVFSRTARNVCPYLKQDITDGLMRISASSVPSALEIGSVFSETGTYGHTETGYWVQVAGYVKDQQTGSSSLVRVGFPIGIRDDTMAPSADGVYSYELSGTRLRFPTYGQLLSDISAYTLGIEADQVVDCSISKRCPFVFRKTSVTVSASRTVQQVDILNTAGNAMTPQLLSDNETVVYRLGNPLPGSLPMAKASQTVTLNIDSAYKRQCGNVQIRDWNENSVMQIPIDGSTMSITFDMHSDSAGIYTIVSHADQEIAIPEGKLPYVENTWATYKAYQMDSDRMSMENAIRFAEYQRDTQRISGSVNAAVSGASAGLMAGFVSGSGPLAAGLGVFGSAAGAITNLWEQDRAAELSRMQAEADMKLSEKRAIQQPQTSYNAGYGLIYCALNQRNDLRACLVMPYDVDSTYFAKWIEEYGYPAEGKRSITVFDGYHQGKLVNDGSITGQRFDELNKTFLRGFKFKVLQ